KRGGINAVTLAAFIGRTVIKNVAEMRIAFAAAHFITFHAKSAIRFLGDLIFVNRFGETGPTTAAVEFIERTEERLAADHIDIDASVMIVPILISKWRFGAALLSDVILLRRQFLLQLFRRRLGRSLISG